MIGSDSCSGLGFVRPGRDEHWREHRHNQSMTACGFRVSFKSRLSLCTKAYHLAPFGNLLYIFPTVLSTPPLYQPREINMALIMSDSSFIQNAFGYGFQSSDILMDAHDSTGLRIEESNQPCQCYGMRCSSMSSWTCVSPAERPKVCSPAVRM